MVTLTPSALVVVLLLTGLFALGGLLRGWSREARLFIWLVAGAILVLVFGDALVSRINDFWRAFLILFKSGFNIRAAFAGAAAQFSSIPPLIPPQWAPVFLLGVFLVMAWWGNLLRRPVRSGGDLLLGLLRGGGPGPAPVGCLARLLAIPRAILRNIPAAILGGVNGYIFAFTIVRLLSKIAATPTETTVISLPVGAALELIRRNLVLIAIVLIGAALLQLALVGVSARSRRS